MPGFGKEKAFGIRSAAKKHFSGYGFVPTTPTEGFTGGHRQVFYKKT
jgi:hypothetical protein